jgi:hypothetical protein
MVTDFLGGRFTPHGALIKVNRLLEAGGTREDYHQVLTEWPIRGLHGGYIFFFPLVVLPVFILECSPLQSNCNVGRNLESLADRRD